jgi:hypothetical protein
MQWKLKIWDYCKQINAHKSVNLKWKTLRKRKIELKSRNWLNEKFCDFLKVAL